MPQSPHRRARPLEPCRHTLQGRADHQEAAVEQLERPLHSWRSKKTAQRRERRQSAPNLDECGGTRDERAVARAHMQSSKRLALRQPATQRSRVRTTSIYPVDAIATSAMAIGANLSTAQRACPVEENSGTVSGCEVGCAAMTIVAGCL